MRLGLSSAAAPDADLGELIAACGARGLGALELRAGDGHGLEAIGNDAIAERLANAGVAIVAFRTESSDNAFQLARLSAELDVAIVTADDCGIEERIERTRRIIEQGGRALVCGRGPASGWHPAVTASGLDFAWEIDAHGADLAADADRVLGGTTAALRYIRFIGGGPESTLHEGRGIGTLMGRLALAGYDGPLILAPSSPRYRVAWATWLGRRGGWGCGSKVADTTLVTLPTRSAAGGSQ